MAATFILILIGSTFLLSKYKKTIFSNLKTMLTSNLEVLWRNRLSLIFLVLLYYLFWEVGQGQDMLVNVNTANERVYQLFISLGAFAVLNWYLPRIVYSENVRAFREPKNKKPFSFIYHYKEKKASKNSKSKTSNSVKLQITKPIEERAARVIGASSIFIVGGAILKIYISNEGNHFQGMPNLPLIYLLTTIALSILFVNFRDIVNMLSKKKLATPINARSYFIRFKKIRFGRQRIVLTIWPKTLLVWSIIILGFIIIVWLGEKNGNILDSLLLLTCSLTVYGFLFLLIVTVRRKSYFIGEAWEYCERLLKKYYVGKEGVLIYYSILSLCIVIIILIVFFNIFPDGVRDYPTAVILSSFSFYFIIFMALDFFGKVYNSPFLFTIILIILVLNISNNNHHDVWLAKDTSFAKQGKRLSFENYFDGWLNHRANEIQNWKGSEKYPVFFVIGEGGGSRGGFWSSYVMSDLQKTGLDSTNIDLISNHCLGMTGASGGQVGLTIFNTFLENDLSDDKKFNKDFITAPRAIYSEDFISTSILFLFGRDMWQGFSPYYIDSPDRAEQIENEWNQAIHSTIGGKEDVFTNSFLSYWYEEKVDTNGFYIKNDNIYKLPLLFLNSTSVENGNRGIISPVTIDDLFLDSRDLIDVVHKDTISTFRKSNGALLGARFPYVSPAGKVADSEHYVDAGYFNNLGGNTAIELYQKCKELQNDSVLKVFNNDLINEVEFHFIVLRNDRHTKDTTESSKVINVNTSEVTVPLSALTVTRNGHTNYSYERLQTISNNNFTSFDIQHPKDTIIPVSRYMSEVAIEAMINSYKYDSLNTNAKSAILELLKTKSSNSSQK